MKTTLQIATLLLTISAHAFADDVGILRCRGIVDASSRLTCYDALAVPGNAKTVAPKPPAPAASAATQSALQASPTASPTASPLAQKIGQFGLENRASAATLDAVDSHIAGRFEGWEAKTNINLANGQVWQIADDSSRHVTMIDPKVRIRRGALGAFYLEFEKTNHSPRVRRVQ